VLAYANDHVGLARSKGEVKRKDGVGVEGGSKKAKAKTKGKRQRQRHRHRHRQRKGQAGATGIEPGTAIQEEIAASPNTPRRRLCAFITFLFLTATRKHKLVLN
jgi:hypothetical protein